LNKIEGCGVRIIGFVQKWTLTQLEMLSRLIGGNILVIACYVVEMRYLLTW